MSALLPPWPSLLAFLAASVVLAVTPGPGVFYIVARSVAQGRAAGLASVAGVALGNLGNAVMAALGLAAILAVSAAAFSVVKYAGAAYLVYLGVLALRNARRASAKAEPLASAVPRRIFLDGFLVALLNPKTALFFGAFLPQFMTPGSSHALQSVALGAVFVVMAATTDTAYALAAAKVAPWLAGRTRVRAGGQYLSGAALLGLGVTAALTGPRPSA